MGMAIRVGVLIGTALGLLLSLSSAAQSPGFVIETFPPKALVYEGSKYLGVSGEALALSPGNHSLTLRLDNHEDKSLTLGVMDIRLGRYPESGTVSLKPKSLSQTVKNWMIYRWQILLPAAVGLAGLAAWATTNQRRWSKHQRILANLVDETQAASHSMMLHQIGNYRVISHLGKGGMADVYQAVPKDSLDTTAAVAIKVMNRDLRDQAEFVQRFLREIVVSQNLAHPGIVEVIEWGWHGERLYLVMEMVEGVQLRKVVPELAADRKRAMNLLAQLMDAVNYAHQRGVAHRDLKPENVMLTKSGRIKVMDFGLARAIDSQTLTQVGSTMGTPKYMAPEMVASASADDRADQYALGIMAYEILTGRLPFDSDEVLYLLYCHANQQPPAPSSVCPDLDEEVDRVLLRMLSKTPRERFRDVEAAKLALQKALGIS